MTVAIARPDESPVADAALVLLHSKVSAHMVLHITELLGDDSAEGAGQLLLDATIYGTNMKLLNIACLKLLVKLP